MTPRLMTLSESSRLDAIEVPWHAARCSRLVIFPSAPYLSEAVSHTIPVAEGHVSRHVGDASQEDFPYHLGTSAW